MADIKLNSDSDDVGTKFKIIGISVTLGLNAIVFIWYFFFSGLTWALSLIDYLFIDECSQVSLADVEAMSNCTKNIILVGDQQQLGMPTKALHPG